MLPEPTGQSVECVGEVVDCRSLSLESARDSRRGEPAQRVLELSGRHLCARKCGIEIIRADRETRQGALIEAICLDRVTRGLHYLLQHVMDERSCRARAQEGKTELPHGDRGLSDPSCRFRRSGTSSAAEGSELLQVGLLFG